ncbi:MAG: hypothetical protein K8R89_03665 [Anaerolineae bacterium]|nr:hypothetical protein [Anaerolineae bacterium]
MLHYQIPLSVQGKIEITEMHGEADLALISMDAQYKTIYTFPIWNGEPGSIYQDTIFSGKSGLKIPIAGGVTAFGEYSIVEGFSGGVEGDILGAQVSLKDDEIMVGWVTPIAGPGIEAGAQFEGGNNLLLTSRGYLRSMGLDKFSRMYVGSDATLKDWRIYQGYWRTDYGHRCTLWLAPFRSWRFL